ncbi:MAG: Lrp/AsnC family transcriptional regulator [Verrucomicrobia bacterium]|nr:Lrp/AsnC family transcriptional regulator [Verrucomicrobiota bacterium]
MDALLQILKEKGRATPAELARLTGKTEKEIEAALKQYEADRVILGYRAILDPDKTGNGGVRAVIEVRITPERDGGFDRIAARVARYPEVVSCQLMSGGYDLLITVEGPDLKQVATFVAEKLSTIQGVISTATHFQLKTYKEAGVLFLEDERAERLAVSP